ncbi:MAG TPA: glycosyltransferase family 2 protein [Chitinophagaceae bacterium]|nr:glycosyltransferase family 2 protein [Chitinophagaceae bacterium]
MKPLSFIIITYNRPGDMLQLLQNICSLENALGLLEEVIVVNNASTDDYTSVKGFINSTPALPFKYFDAPENLGVAKGRNFAMAKGNAPIIIMLDDDAVLQNKDCLTNLVKEFEESNTERPKAIVSFKVLYFDDLQMQKNALPHKNFEEYKNKPSFETYYYAGGAHAIRREVIETLGRYPADFFYGMEEYDLAYRILDAGYSIVYSDKIVMLHKESPLGRKTKKEKLQMMWLNKSKVAWRYLPKKYFYSTALMWSIQYLKETRFNIGGFFSGWKRIFFIPSTEKRTLIKQTTMNYLRKVKARLWY